MFQRRIKLRKYKEFTKNIDKMPEQQNIEYKQSWHEEYLKWVCGFANAIGAIFYIGIVFY